MTAELAVAVPAVLLVLAVCLGGLRVAGERLRLVDAAAQAARAASLGESPATAASRAGARVASVAREGETVCVRLGKTVALAGVPLPVDAASCALSGPRP